MGEALPSAPSVNLTRRTLHPANRVSAALRGVDCHMSDEMVQEKTSPVVATERGNGHEEGQSSANAMPVSSTAAAGAAATDEPAPAQPVAVEPTAPVGCRRYGSSPVGCCRTGNNACIGCRRYARAACRRPRAQRDGRRRCAFEKEMQALATWASSTTAPCSSCVKTK